MIYCTLNCRIIIFSADKYLLEIHIVASQYSIRRIDLLFRDTVARINRLHRRQKEDQHIYSENETRAEIVIIVKGKRAYGSWNEDPIDPRSERI